MFKQFLILALAVTIISGSIPAYADVESIFSDKLLYQKGETVVFSGTVGDLDVNEPVSIIIRDSENNFVVLETTRSDYEGNFQINLDVDENFTSNGLYSAQLYLNDVATMEFTYFDFSSNGSTIQHSEKEEKILASQHIKSNFKEIIDTDQIQLTDRIGNPLKYASDETPVQISADVINNNEQNQPFTYFVQIQNDSEQVISISWISGMLVSKQKFDVSLSWTPESQGTYKATVFVWDNIKNSTPLSEPKVLSITVA
ncbi:hypothetical protein [Nitrosopumilus ureiphilus]|uniref:Uncharacterized protein n=1 Tax=Nitrosopumilus ureiphilus TaxID=1470067 RepID=A0A7D5RG96_9ARCH|nr:hypothetical protein [Nitrosopumilus ureiphilus]QLH06545.1 hypothetical protein C5F50_05285 [Nitrosopumilus ureiphilus]